MDPLPDEAFAPHPVGYGSKDKAATGACRSLALAAALAEGRPHVDAALGARPHDAAVDAAGHAVEHLHVELRQREGAVDAGLPDVTLRRGVDHVAHLEALDGFVLRHTA